MATKLEFPPGQDMRDILPEDVKDAKERAKASKAYDRALTTTEPAPKEMVKKAKGGSASSRADGCAQRGKTKGTYV